MERTFLVIGKIKIPEIPITFSLSPRTRHFAARSDTEKQIMSRKSASMARRQFAAQPRHSAVPSPVQAHSCACPTQQASPSPIPPHSAALRGSGRSPVSLASKVAHAAPPQFAALQGSGRSPVSLPSEVAHAAAPQSAAFRGSGRSPVSLASKGGVA